MVWEGKLQPYNKAVTVGLIIVAALLVYVAYRGSAVQKTGALVYVTLI